MPCLYPGHILFPHTVIIKTYFLIESSLKRTFRQHRPLQSDEHKCHARTVRSPNISMRVPMDRTPSPIWYAWSATQSSVAEAGVKGDAPHPHPLLFRYWNLDKYLKSQSITQAVYAPLHTQLRSRTHVAVKRNQTQQSSFATINHYVFTIFI